MINVIKNFILHVIVASVAFSLAFSFTTLLSEFIFKLLKKSKKGKKCILFLELKPESPNHVKFAFVVLILFIFSLCLVILWYLPNILKI